MELIDLIRDEACSTTLKAGNKDKCLHKLAGLMAQALEGVEADDIYNCLIERESIGSTGFEDGIAIPHGKMAGLDEFAVLIAVSPKGIDFESIDGKKSHIFFVVIGPDDEERTKEHLQILAQISRITRMNKARRELLQAPTPFVLKEMFTRFLPDTGNGKPKGKDKLLMIVLYEMKFLEDILDVFIERDIRGATVMESTGLRADLSNIPLFSNFFNFLGETSDASKTIMTMVKESEVAGIVNEIEEIMGDLDTHTGATVFALDVFFTKGSMEV